MSIYNFTQTVYQIKMDQRLNEHKKFAKHYQLEVATYLEYPSKMVFISEISLFLLFLHIF